MRVTNYSQVDCTRLMRARGRARALKDSTQKGVIYYSTRLSVSAIGGACAQLRVLRNCETLPNCGVSRAPSSGATLLTLMKFS